MIDTLSSNLMLICIVAFFTGLLWRAICPPCFLVMVRGRDACWEHCVLVDATRQKVRCNYCHREFSGGVYRMKFHLAQIKNKDIVPCTEVPDDVRDHIRGILSTPKKQKTPKKLKVERAANAQQNSSSASGGAHPNHGSSGQHGSTGPSLLFPRPSPSAQPEVDDAQKKRQDDVDKKIAEWMGMVLEEAKTITSYMYSHAWTLNMMRKFTGGRELIRPRISRFVTDYLSLSAIVIQEDNLKNMFSHSECLSSMHRIRPEAQAIKSLLYQDRFWKSAHEAVSVSEPLIKILRIVDGDMPAMGYIYEGIERAKAAIKGYYKGIEEKYMPIWEIIDRRWNLQLHSPLQAAAAFLNPSIFYNPNFKIDLRMRNGFQDTMIKMATTNQDKIEITKEHPIYINAQGALGTEFAIMGRTLNSPGMFKLHSLPINSFHGALKYLIRISFLWQCASLGDWWAGYGYEIPTLQRVAIKILSQPCSSHWCRWNWSTFESVHTKKRNRAELEKFNDLLFAHCNLWLQAITQSHDGKCKPIIYDEIDVSSEWPTEMEPSTPLLDDSWLDNLPLECGGSP
ncbi:hypothetical protein SADUNF_Sadunf01G0094900 [Salix dunnii]|uniref:BED-type domain-containing protein n=1 Tax=Salix dunnii TaxID=1413687 RepID=A0A835NBE3_9ROSI|nr:hypothetical protein SADUNF_Sadunf01G0094900 [Salix dunnii]